MKSYFLIIFLFVSLLSLSQSSHQLFVKNHFKAEFDKAYQQYPDIPKGLLEAISFSMTRFTNIQNNTETCSGIPHVYGPMGLTPDGKNYFRNNLDLIAKISGFGKTEILSNPEQNILAYASTYQTLIHHKQLFEIEKQFEIIAALSELPYDGLQKDFALNSFIYQIYWFLNNPKAQEIYQIPKYKIDLTTIFGKENLQVLSSHFVTIEEKQIENENGITYHYSGINHSIQSTDYPPAIEDLTTCNYSSRSGTAITAITIHDTEGSYAGSISWFKNCDANVSAHYVLRSSDGQVTQMVLESNKAWHVGSENPYTIGLEHEGYANETGWYTDAMYQSSADLARDIVQSGYGISPLRVAYFPWAATTNYSDNNTPGECIRIKGHQHYPNQTHTDPGQNWDWDYYYKLINISTSVTTLTNESGTITDDGGTTGNYSDDQRQIISIQPTNASSITLNIQQFDIEDQWDYLYIYDGNSVFSNKIGEYTATTIPSTIQINGPSVTVEFRADCATNKSGFIINWESQIIDTEAPTTQITNIPTPYATSNFTAQFVDQDPNNGSGVKQKFYQVSDFDNLQWSANSNHGFYRDDFSTLNSNWNLLVGNWSVQNNKLQQNLESNSNTNIYSEVNQNTADSYLYHFNLNIDGSESNKRAGLHFMCDDATQTNRGNSYLVYFRENDNQIEFFKSDANNLSSEKIVTFDILPNQDYDIKIIYTKINGLIEVFIDNTFIDSWQDPNPIQIGDYISFRTGNCILKVNQFSILKNRNNSTLISIGNTLDNDIRYENPDASTASGNIQSIVIDSAQNISSLVSEEVNVNFDNTLIKKTDTKEYKIYPNPFIDQISIENINNKPYSIHIFDIRGKEILFKKVNSNQKNYTLNLSTQNLSKGIYSIKLQNNSNSQILQLIKE